MYYYNCNPSWNSLWRHFGISGHVTHFVQSSYPPWTKWREVTVVPYLETLNFNLNQNVHKQNILLGLFHAFASCRGRGGGGLSCGFRWTRELCRLELDLLVGSPQQHGIEGEAPNEAIHPPYVLHFLVYSLISSLVFSIADVSIDTPPFCPKLSWLTINRATQASKPNKGWYRLVCWGLTSYRQPAVNCFL